MKRVLIRVVVGVMIPIVGASAQSVGTRFGLDAAPFYVTIDGENFSGIDSGFGFDVQGRLMGPAWSVGLGMAPEQSRCRRDHRRPDLERRLRGAAVSVPRAGILPAVCRGPRRMGTPSAQHRRPRRWRRRGQGVWVDRRRGRRDGVRASAGNRLQRLRDVGPTVVSRRGGERPNRCRFRSEGDERVFARRCVVHVRRSLALATTRPVSAVRSTPALSPDRHGSRAVRESPSPPTRPARALPRLPASSADRSR
jgi:hypothetical protein